MSKKNAISPTREEDYSQWYLEVIKAADLAEHSPVRGCMVIKPWGYGIWENIQKVLNGYFKKNGVENAYFPLFIPLSFLEKEAKHVEGFAKECAVVTHHRLEGKEGKLVPAGQLEEPLIVRPTSEMIIGHMFSKWVKSFRDLPIKINQWANVVRWEMRTRLFLRTTEFLWQEGHTVFASKEEALEDSYKMLKVYEEFCRDFLAIPTIPGEKTETERFPGAEKTFSIETMMQDKKALQAGTSHFLGQNFAKSCEIVFQDEQQNVQYAWTSSWGVATRLIGALVMTHSDDDGLILPPRIAPKHIVILPVIHSEEKKKEVMDYCENLLKDLENIDFYKEKLQVHIDTRAIRGGEKKWGWIKKGIPLYLEIGPKDIEKDSVFLGRRDQTSTPAKSIARREFLLSVVKILDDIQNHLYAKALLFQKTHTTLINSKEEFFQFFAKDSGFALCYYSVDGQLEERLKEELGVTPRCIPFADNQEEGMCIFSGKMVKGKTIFAKAY